MTAPPTRAATLSLGGGPLRICLSPGGTGGGGIGVVMLNLAEGFLAQGHAVDLLELGRPEDRPPPPGVTAVPLGPRGRFALPPILRYLRAARPDVVISARDSMNLLMLAGLTLAGLRMRTRLVWTYHTHASTQQGALRSLRTRAAGRLADRLARAPDARVAVSQGVAHDLEARVGLPAGSVTVVGNPVWTAARLAQREAPCPHPWLAHRAPGERDASAPVVLGIGRLTAQKDFGTLLEAFARLRAARPAARLLILGEGEARPALAAQAGSLGLADAVDLAGQVPSALPHLSRADLFVLSSRWEGLPTVLIEAMGAGCPVVATDCPSGPAELLEGGRLGRLVPVGDPEALARAMDAALAAPGDPGPGIAAALRFDAPRAAAGYLAALGAGA